MAEKVEVEVTITPEGEVIVKTHGLKGQTCVAEIDAVAKVVGKVKKRTNTSEYYQQTATGKGTTKTR